MKYAYRLNAVHKESGTHVRARYQTKTLALTACTRMFNGYWRVVDVKRILVSVDCWTHQCRRTSDPPTVSDDGGSE